ncbi:MAG: metallophosphoesterase [Treponema sp.]|jgi:rubrerythrin|nr:metallophosphoesterase [Treponema sp.]
MMVTLNRGIQKIEQPVIETADFRSFSVLGDPGCDGLGAEIMAVFADLLLEAADTDFTLILGDVVPFGSKLFYDNVVDLIGVTAKTPVFVLCGNHDTDFYADHFGNADYAVADSRTLIIVLDNSDRVINPLTRAFLQKTLEDYRRPNVVLAMHIPPPNAVSGNSISSGEWEKISSILEPFRPSLRYILSGHVHSYFEDDLDGVKLIGTGGGGARIEEVPGVTPPYYHRVRFFYNDGGGLEYKREDLALEGRGRRLWDERIQALLSESFVRECTAHVRYRLYAEDAARRGLPNLARLLRAAAEAEYCHARNFQYVSGDLKNPAEALAGVIADERCEVNEFYKTALALAREKQTGLPVYAFADTLRAEKVHAELFEAALQSIKRGRDIEAAPYYTCSSCGNTFSSRARPKNCPVCGAPMDKIFGVL